jgi:hypothetical protein
VYRFGQEVRNPARRGANLVDLDRPLKHSPAARALHQDRPRAGHIRPADVTGMHVLRRDRLGGLIGEYSQVA